MTKRELLRYTAQIAPTVLPYLRGRALNMHRFPGEVGSKGFWHKELPKHAPDWVPRWDNPKADPGETRTYLVVDESALDHLGVRAGAKVTGQRGIQIWIPIAPGPSFEDTRAWVEQLSKTVGAVVPELVSWK